MGKKILILGGTGTLGTALAERLGRDANNEITILSRDEFKLSQMKKRFPAFKYVIGDIRDIPSISPYFDVNEVFQCAALKHVDMGEDFTDQFMKTNYIGTKNCFDVANRAGVERFFFFSTDKAVLPINSYGFSKALAENYIRGKKTNMVSKIFRWGNIIGSRGSVFGQWEHAISNHLPLNVTDLKMTRFWMLLDEAVEFVMSEILDISSPSGTYIPDIKAASIMDMIEALQEFIEGDCERTLEFNVTGIRPGEKIHEVLFSSHNYCVRSDTGPQYSRHELLHMMGEYIG